MKWSWLLHERGLEWCGREFKMEWSHLNYAVGASDPDVAEIQHAHVKVTVTAAS